jgi:hypothetical protein
VSHSSNAASSRPEITAGMNCLRLMRCEFVNERTQVNVEIRIMPLYWLCYRHNNQISVVIEPGASLVHARLRASLKGLDEGTFAGASSSISCAPPTVIARSPLLTCPVQRDAGDSAERARLRSSPDCQAEDALFAARSLQAQHLVLSASLFAVVATT